MLPASNKFGECGSGRERPLYRRRTQMDLRVTIGCMSYFSWVFTLY